jgi:hypothetical protein
MPFAHFLMKVAAVNHEKTVAFYKAALKPLGYEKVFEVGSGTVGFGVKNFDWFVSSTEKDDVTSKVHMAFEAPGKLKYPASFRREL